MKPVLINESITANRLIFIKRIDAPYLDTPFHFHDNCELVFIEDGYGNKLIGDNVSVFTKDDIILMGPNVPHIFTNDDLFYKGNKNLRSKATVIYFSPKLLDHLLSYNALDPFYNLIKRASRGLEIIGNTRDAICKELANFTEKEELFQLSSFFYILNLLLKTKEVKYIISEKFTNTYSQQDSARISSVYQFLMQNFKRNIQLEEAAEIAHMAPTAFCRFFKQRTLKTFSRFMNELRIHHACELLSIPDKTITDVFYECGFNNPTNFNKFFKEITGTTPSEYRKKL